MGRISSVSRSAHRHILANGQANGHFMCVLLRVLPPPIKEVMFSIGVCFNSLLLRKNYLTVFHKVLCKGWHVSHGINR